MLRLPPSGAGSAGTAPFSARRGVTSHSGALSARGSSRGRSSLVESGRSCLAAPPSVASRAAEAAASASKSTDSGDEDDEDFRALRRHAKMSSTVRPGSKDAGRAKPSKPLAVPSVDRASQGVDPCYFDYGASVRRLDAQRKKEAAEVTSKRPSDFGDTANDQDLAELVKFMTLQGLQGPVKCYARAMVLQGILDTSGLVEASDTKLSKILRLAELDSTDEIMLLEGLRQFR
eukprot:TRINITY_DN106518_c0_g1_i1.p1 TRINITY_DN106518_c0_g1~~TRINITY_DN106518_c0_g1_i1.p1  ORF type:complete len:232 (-),score=52.06 TRINITY_DN106518_c0_g1_i1:60-755(-)